MAWWCEIVVLVEHILGRAAHTSRYDVVDLLITRPSCDKPALCKTNPCRRGHQPQIGTTPERPMTVSAGNVMLLILLIVVAVLDGSHGRADRRFEYCQMLALGVTPRAAGPCGTTPDGRLRCWSD